MQRRSYRRPGRLVPPTARGLRARTVVLQAGQSMDWHSTHCREELLIMLRGQIRVEDASSRMTRHRHLLPGHCVFLPQQTLHRIVNRSRQASTYLYVTAPACGQVRRHRPGRRCTLSSGRR